MSDSTTTIYDLKTLSKKFNISVRILRRYIKKGDLIASKVGRSYYVTDFNLGLFLNLKEVVLYGYDLQTRQDVLG